MLTHFRPPPLLRAAKNKRSLIRMLEPPPIFPLSSGYMHTMLLIHLFAWCLVLLLSREPYQPPLLPSVASEASSRTGAASKLWYKGAPFKFKRQRIV
jgi:hypothetical protein